MSLRNQIVVFAIAATAMVASNATAQDRHRHDRDRAEKANQYSQKHRGFWLGFGLGGGWNTWRWSLGNDGGRGGAAYVRMGGTVNQHVLFGGEVLTWFNDDGGSRTLQRVNATATALLYPGSNGGLFFKGGFGVASSEVQGNERAGIGTTVGAGIDLRLGGNFYVTPNVDVLTQFFERDTNSSLLFTLGLGWH